MSFKADVYNAKVERFHRMVKRFLRNYVPPSHHKEFINLINMEGRLMSEKYHSHLEATIEAVELILKALKDLQEHLDSQLIRYPEVTDDEE